MSKSDYNRKERIACTNPRHPERQEQILRCLAFLQKRTADLQCQLMSLDSDPDARVNKLDDSIRLLIHTFDETMLQLEDRFLLEGPKVVRARKNTDFVK